MTATEKRQLLRDLKWIADLAEEMCESCYPSMLDAAEANTITTTDAQMSVRVVEKRLRAIVRAQPVSKGRTLVLVDSALELRTLEAPRADVPPVVPPTADPSRPRSCNACRGTGRVSIPFEPTTIEPCVACAGQGYFT